MAAPFHRFDDLYLSRAEWRAMPGDQERIALALGTEPLDDQRHLLAPVPLTSPAPSPPSGPNPAIHLIVPIRLTAAISSKELVDAVRGDDALVGAALWGRAHGFEWQPVAPVSEPGIEFVELALAWNLAELPGDSLTEIEHAVRRRHVAADRVARSLGGACPDGDSPLQTALRAAGLHALKRRFAGSCELHLRAAGRPFFARDVWRALAELGIHWGDLDLFHWHDPATGRRLFTVSRGDTPGYFLPERAAQGERIAGLNFGFELPTCPAPRETFDRMAVALAFCRERLGGRPTTASGADLDGERLEEERRALLEVVSLLEQAGASPGSPAALALF